MRLERETVDFAVETAGVRDDAVCVSLDVVVRVLEGLDIAGRIPWLPSWLRWTRSRKIDHALEVVREIRRSRGCDDGDRPVVDSPFGR